MKLRQIAITLPDVKIEKLKRVAQAQGRKVAPVVGRVVENWLDDQDDPQILPDDQISS